VCGARAVRRAHADYDALSKSAQLFSSSLDETPSAIAAQLDASRAAEKALKKLQLDLAAYRGRELYDRTAPGPDGVRRVTERLDRGSLEELPRWRRTSPHKAKAYSSRRLPTRRPSCSRPRPIRASTRDSS